MTVELLGSWSGNTSGGWDDVGRIPICWCWRSAWPRVQGLSVRVSAMDTRSLNGPKGNKERRTIPTESYRQSINTGTTFNFIDDDLTTSFYTTFCSLRVIKRAAATIAATDNVWPSTLTGWWVLHEYHQLDSKRKALRVRTYVSISHSAPLWILITKG